MLQLIYRCALDKGTNYFKYFFTASSAKQAHEKKQAYGMHGSWFTSKIHPSCILNEEVRVA